MLRSIHTSAALGCLATAIVSVAQRRRDPRWPLASAACAVISIPPIFVMAARHWKNMDDKRRKLIASLLNGGAQNFFFAAMYLCHADDGFAFIGRYFPLEIPMIVANVGAVILNGKRISAGLGLDKSYGLGKLLWNAPDAGPWVVIGLSQGLGLALMAANYLRPFNPKFASTGKA